MSIIELHRQRQANQKQELRQEAVRLCRTVAQKYAFKKMYLFGSAVNAHPVSVWSDIDLVVEGLPEAEYYNLVGYMNGHSSHKVDLKTYETLQPEFQDTLATEGIIIYERR